MAQVYSARQLNFFKSALEILQSAIYKTQLPASTAPDLSETSANTENRAYSPVVGVSRVKNSAAFSQSLPWQALSSANVTIPDSGGDFGPVQADIEPVASSKVGAVSSAFFQSLPWHKQPAAVIYAGAIDIVQPAEAPAVGSTPTLQSNQSCSEFFQSLPWHTAAALSAKNGVIAPKKISLSAQTIQIPSAAFFHGLPWQGASQATENKRPVAVLNSDDFATIASMATQTAMQAAQSAVDKRRKLVGETASGFFKALRW